MAAGAVGAGTHAGLRVRRRVRARAAAVSPHLARARPLRIDQLRGVPPTARPSPASQTWRRLVSPALRDCDLLVAIGTLLHPATRPASRRLCRTPRRAITLARSGPCLARCGGGMLRATRHRKGPADGRQDRLGRVSARRQGLRLRRRRAEEGLAEAACGRRRTLPRRQARRGAARGRRQGRAQGAGCRRPGRGAAGRLARVPSRRLQGRVRCRREARPDRRIGRGEGPRHPRDLPGRRRRRETQALRAGRQAGRSRGQGAARRGQQPLPPRLRAGPLQPGAEHRQGAEGRASPARSAPRSTPRSNWPRSTPRPTPRWRSTTPRSSARSAP